MSTAHAGDVRPITNTGKAAHTILALVFITCLFFVEITGLHANLLFGCMSPLSLEEAANMTLPPPVH
jgi:hypothetical protein